MGSVIATQVVGEVLRETDPAADTTVVSQIIGEVFEETDPVIDAVRASQITGEVFFEQGVLPYFVSQIVGEIFAEYAFTPTSCFIVASTANFIESVSPNYYVELTDEYGIRVALFDSWRTLEFGHTVNGVGYYNIEFTDDEDARFGFFKLDSQIRIFRSIPGCNLNWYNEFSGFHRKPLLKTTDQGDKTFSSSGFGYNDLLRRKRIAYNAGTIRADKDAPAETVMKEYVLENCGSMATIGGVVGRWIDGVFPGFQVEPGLGRGTNWIGSRAYENLLEVLEDIANVTATDFRVENITEDEFMFKTYLNQLGSDRTTIGLNSGTGKNSAGNYPIVFSLDMQNITDMEYIFDHSSESNVCLVLGDGDGSTRDVVVRKNDTARASSPFNSIETTTQGSNNEFTYQLEMLGDEVLQQNKAQEIFNLTIYQTPTYLYGLHYFLGDRVTLKYENLEAHKKIVGIKVVVSEQSEQITIEFADIPTVK